MTQDLPIAKAAYSFLEDNVPSSFSFPKWNKGRILCQRPQLKRILSSIEPSTDGSERKKIITLSNSPFPPPGTKTSSKDVNSGRYNDVTSDERLRIRTELLTSAVQIHQIYSSLTRVWFSFTCRHFSTRMGMLRDQFIVQFPRVLNWWRMIFRVLTNLSISLQRRRHQPNREMLSSTLFLV